MKKFKYRLAPLLKLKEHIENERQKSLALSRSKVMTQEESLGKIDRQKGKTLADQANKLSGKISVAEMLIYSRYLVRLKREQLTGNEMLKVLKKDESQKRRELLEASRERKVYEKLREKQQARFLNELSRSEAKESDEIAVSNHRRRH